MTFVRHDGSGDGQAVVGGVTPAARRLGAYRTLLVAGMRGLAAEGATRMIVSTQVTNVAVQKVWARLGFEPGWSRYTLHKWFV